MFRLGKVLSFLPDRVTKQKRYNNTMLFRMESEFPPVIQIRLKIEINCFEHFNELGLVKIPFVVENSRLTGRCGITTYQLNELLGTKLRALYQRKKGRDLFDLYVALTKQRLMWMNLCDVIIANMEEKWQTRIFGETPNCSFIPMSLLIRLRVMKLSKRN